MQQFINQTSQRLPRGEFSARLASSFPLEVHWYFVFTQVRRAASAPNAQAASRTCVSRLQALVLLGRGQRQTSPCMWGQERGHPEGTAHTRSGGSVCSCFRVQEENPPDSLQCRYLNCHSHCCRRASLRSHVPPKTTAQTGP